MLSRDLYEYFFILLGGGRDLDRAQVLAGEYPKNTQEAIGEMRTRGIDANPARLEYLFSRGLAKGPRTVGGARVWNPKDIDRVAAALEQLEFLTPKAQACSALGVSLDDWHRALLDVAPRMNNQLGVDLDVGSVEGFATLVMGPMSNPKVKFVTPEEAKKL